MPATLPKRYWPGRARTYRDRGLPALGDAGRGEEGGGAPSLALARQQGDGQRAPAAQDRGAAEAREPADDLHDWLRGLGRARRERGEERGARCVTQTFFGSF